MGQSDTELLDELEAAVEGLTWAQIEARGLPQSSVSDWLTRHKAQRGSVDLRPGSRQKIRAFLQARAGGEVRVLEIAREMERLAAELRELSAPASSDANRATKTIAQTRSLGGSSAKKGKGGRKTG